MIPALILLTKAKKSAIPPEILKIICFFVDRANKLYIHRVNDHVPNTDTRTLYEGVGRPAKLLIKKNIAQRIATKNGGTNLENRRKTAMILDRCKRTPKIRYSSNVICGKSMNTGAISRSY